MKLIEAIIIAPLLLIALTGCVTAGDLRGLADQVRLETEAGADRATTFADELDALAETVDERTAAAKEGLSGLQQGGIIGLLGTVATSVLGTNAIRDRRRRKRNEVTGDVLARVAPPVAPPAP